MTNIKKNIKIFDTITNKINIPSLFLLEIPLKCSKPFWNFFKKLTEGVATR